MPDHESTTIEAAAYLARDILPPEPDRPTWREARADENPPPYRVADDPYRGICGGCKRPVSASGPEGSCIWTGGAWHPSCRSEDPAWLNRYERREG